MGIVWTHWKVAMARERSEGSSVVFTVVVVVLLVIVTSGLPDGEMDWRNLIDVARHPVILSLPFILLGFLPLGCHFQVHALTEKTFSFCLPGHRESLRRLYFSCAALGGLVFCLWWMVVGFGLGQSQEAAVSVWPHGVLSALGSFLGGMAILLAISASRLVLHPLVWGVLAFVAIPFGFICFFGLFVVCQYPLVPIPIGSVVLIFFWVRLGKMRYVRRSHRAILNEAMDPRFQLGFARPAPTWVDNLFLGRAEQCRPLGLGRYIWASFYRTFGSVLSYWKWVLSGAILASVGLGLMGRSFAEMMFVSLGLVAATAHLPAASSLLLPGGSREQFWGSVAAGVAMSVLLVALAVVIGGVSEIVALRSGAGAGDVGLRIASAWLACVLVPWMCAQRVGGAGVLRIVNGAGATVVFFLALLLCGQALDFSAWPTPRRYLVLASILLCGWVLFLVALRQVCRRGCLIGQTVYDED